MAQERYWMFDGKDAVGPFLSEELKRQPFFGPETLICPDGSEDAGQWRAAKYYLIRPPGSRGEPARSPEPAPVAAAVAEPEYPSVLPAPRPAPQPAPIPTRTIAIAAAALLVPVAAYFALHNRSRAKRLPAPAAAQNPATEQAAAPPAEPAAPPVPALNQDAVDFVEKFPVQSGGMKLPPSESDIFSPRRWRTPATVGEALEMRSFYSLGQAASTTLQKQGHTVEAGEAELRRNADRWEAYARRWLKANARLDWRTELAVAGSSKYRVEAELRLHREGAVETHAFEADLDRRTLKPLDTGAWCDLDPKACARWGDKNIKLGVPFDEAQAAAAAPAYPYPIPKRGMHHKPGFEAPVAAAPAPKKVRIKAAPKPKPAEEAPPPSEESDYPDQAAGPKAADDPLSQATAEPAPRPSPAPQAAPSPRESDDLQPPQGQGGKPSSAKAPAKQAAAPAAAPSNKSATDMTVDELEKYLSRGSGGKN
jgi:hypothetical protein